MTGVQTCALPIYKELKSLYVKWRLYKNNTLLSEGNFSPSFDVKENNRLVLTEVQQDLTTNTDKYVYLMWISEVCTGDITTCDSTLNQNKYSNKTFNASIKIEASTKTKKELVRTKAVIGDIYEDGRITNRDATLMNNFLLGELSLTKQQLFNADVNADGKINEIDYLLFKRFILKAYYQNILPNEPITDYIFYGDVNEDGEINSVFNSTVIYDYVVNNKSLNYQQLKNADVNGDGKVDLVDSILLYRFALGEYPSTLPDISITDYLLYGDVNEDGKITEEDSTLLSNYLNNNTNISDQALKNSDVNGDGKINIIDLGLLQMYIETPDNYTDTLPESPITDYTIQYGDVNLDGEVDTFDVTESSNYYLDSTSSLKGQQLLNADVNGDGKINRIDTALIFDLSFGTKINSPMTDYTLYGDLNNDGILDNNDIDKLTRYLRGSTGLDNQARKNADVNGDGVINNTDLTLLQNKINNSTSSPVVASTTPITS